jgi:cystathionine gamma-synthase
VDIPSHQIPFATPIPARPHAISCSFPSMSDVVRYEKREAAVQKQIKIAYPRFVSHHRVLQWESFLQEKYQLADSVIYCVCSTHAAKDLQRYVGFRHVKVVPEEAYAVVAVEKQDDIEFKARKFLQHTGCRISSRQAEDLLIENGLMEGSMISPDPHAYETLQDVVTEKTGARTNGDVFLTNSGMNAIYAAFRAIQEVQAKQERTLWIQLGWIYVDTYEILNKFAGSDDHKIFIPDPTNLEELESVLKNRGDQVAGIISELPTNPLVQTPDLERLFELSKAHGVALIVDPTVSSVLNVDVLPFCDVLVTSLTKYLSHEGDVMMGAVALQSASAFYTDIKAGIAAHAEPPYSRDIVRVVEQLDNMENVASTVNANTIKLAAFFEAHPGVKKVHWAYEAGNASCYCKIEKEPDSPGGMITIDLVKPIAEFYDKCRISKGPSFGMELTIMSPFMYMAHYDIVSSDTGPDELRAYGINPDLIRISVGTEPIEQIIAAFDEAL